ncbi:AMP-binding protein, partial [Frankia sp. EI5c]|uniref:AMP-binding protein n=1 Tax=Frankia sp. EI5c TaxID=683316 RepID=UPI0037C171CE
MLLDWIERARVHNGRIVFLSSDYESEISWPEFFTEAETVAAWLQNARGVGRGRRVVILGMPSRPTVTAVAGTWLSGASVTFAPTPARGVNLGTYIDETSARVAMLGESLVLLDAQFEALTGPMMASGAEVVRMADVSKAEDAGAWKPPDLTAEDEAILQFTSGTTGDPKIVRVSHGNLAANITALKERNPHEVTCGGRKIPGYQVLYGHEAVPDGYKVDSGRVLSWLPLSHDMGLVGVLATQFACGRCDLLLGSPADYLASPQSWMRNAARHRATFIVGPASAYAVAGRLLKAGPVLDLSNIRTAVSGGEPIDPEIIESFL